MRASSSVPSIGGQRYALGEKRRSVKNQSLRREKKEGLSGYDYLYVISDEESAFNNSRNHFDSFLEGGIDVMEAGVEDKVPVFGDDGTVFAAAGGAEGDFGGSHLQEFAFGVAEGSGEDFDGDGELAAQLVHLFGGVDYDKSFIAAADEQLFFKHGSAASFYQAAVGVHFVGSVEGPVRAFLPEGGLGDAELDAGEGDFFGGGDDLDVQAFFANAAGEGEEGEVDGGAGAGADDLAVFRQGGDAARYAFFRFAVGDEVRPLEVVDEMVVPVHDILYSVGYLNR